MGSVLGNTVAMTVAGPV